MVVATPITNITAYVAFFALIFTTIRLAKLPIRTVLGRALIEIPFVLFALLMPFFGTGEKIELAGLSLYKEGVQAGAAIVAKGTLGVLVAITLSATTTAREILSGLEKLRLPLPLVNIAAFMLRYLNVINDEMTRMRIARESRGFEARGISSWRVLAQTIGSLFIRSYERGERVYLAMLARGFNGRIPRDNEPQYRNNRIAFLLPISALIISILTGALI